MSEALIEKLISLLDVDAKRRRHTVEDFEAEELDEQAVVDALSRLLATDQDVAVRAASAEALGKVRWPRASSAGPALISAMEDVSPVVRDAAIRGLARRRDPRAMAALRERAAGDLVWWVRRAALYTLGVIAGTGPSAWAPQRSPLLAELAKADGRHDEAADAALAAQFVDYVIAAARAALSDPFWRVRHAAVQVLAVLGRQDAERRDEILADVEGGSADYLRALWGPTLVEDPRAPQVASRLPEALADRDPAVVTARLETMPEPPALALVELLCDPHVPLRQIAVRRLLELADPAAFAAALRWLDEPRIPHVATTVIEMLDGLGDPARQLAEQVLTAPARVGASRWAIGWVVATGDEALEEAAWQRAVQIGEPELALRLAPPEFLVEALRASGEPSPSRLGVAAADELLLRPAAQQQEILHQLFHPIPAFLAKEIFARLAVIAPLGGELLRSWASRQSHPSVSAVACGRLAAAGLLEEEELLAAAGHASPMVREAVIDKLPPLALANAFYGEIDPWVRRRAGRALLARAKRGALGEVVAALPADKLAIGLAYDADPQLRAEAIALVDPKVEDHVLVLLPLLVDAAPMVQAAMIELLLAVSPETLEKGRGLLKPEARAVLDQWLLAADPLLLAAEQDEDTDSESASELKSSGIRTVAVASSPKSSPAVAQRPLGRAGLTAAPLCISGAFDLSPGSLHAAVDAGADLFFWEPTYPAMARFLRGDAMRARTKVVTGSYHADAASIEKDVHRALRRLRRDTLDVFLLFWARSSARLDEEAYAILERLQRAGHLRATGFSTHDRALAMAALDRSPWDVVMTRHSAAHPGIEAELLPHAQARGASVLTFSALCYGRMVSGPGAPSPADCYRYSLSQPGVSACISAPRRHRELVENLAVLEQPALADEQLAALRRHGEGVRLENQRFGSLIRQPTRDAAAAAMSLLEASLPPGPPGEEAVSSAAPTAASLGRSLTARNPSRRLRRGRL